MRLTIIKYCKVSLTPKFIAVLISVIFKIFIQYFAVLLCYSIVDNESTAKEFLNKPKKKKNNNLSPEQVPEKKIEYISTKKPIEKSIFYQHSKQGMKYWFEEQKPKTCK